MKFCLTLNTLLEELHLLKHPFYQSWNEGTLTLDTLKIYAKEYYHHVAAFPRYISQIHSLCPDISDRQVLLENLIDEEKGENNHPELWLRFAEGVGVLRKEVKQPPELNTTKGLVEGYFELVRTDYATGLGALYAYERQTPEVSKSNPEKYNGDDAELFAEPVVNTTAGTLAASESLFALIGFTYESCPNGAAEIG